MILDTSTVDRDVALDADVCVVGSGAGGSVVAHALAGEGKRVVIVEEGGYHSRDRLTQREEEMLPRLYAAHGVQALTETSVAVLRGRAVGGSTLVGQCLCARLPRSLLAHWRRSAGLSLHYEELAHLFERVEELIGARPLLPADINRNNGKLKIGAERLGLHNYLPSHNRVDCLGCGFCALGCAYDRKGDALTALLPEAMRRGALIIPDCRAERVETRNGRAGGVRGSFMHGRGESRANLTVHAPVVILAAGAIGSAALWLRSSLPDPAQQVGSNLHLQPQVTLAAVFDDDVKAWQGIPQSVIVDEFLDLDRAPTGGYLLVSTSAHPGMAAALLPGSGRGLDALMGAYARQAMASVVLHDRTSGRVEIDANGEAVLVYNLGDDDRADIVDGMRRLSDIYFAAGAQRVILPFNDVVELTRRGDYRALEQQPWRGNDPLLLSHAPQGTLHMGSDPDRSVVNQFGEAHALKGLYVADSSVFPTSAAVPPQLTVMALALRTAQHLAQSI